MEDKLDRPELRGKEEELVEKCMPTLERFEEIEKQVFYPIPKPVEFSSTIRFYASTMSREAVRKTLTLIPVMDGGLVEWAHRENQAPAGDKEGNKMTDGELLLTPEERKGVRQKWLIWLKGQPEMPKHYDLITMTCEAQLAKAKQHYEPLIEKCELTDEETFHLHAATPYKCGSRELDAYCRGMDEGAQALKDKILKEIENGTTKKV